MGKIYTLCDKTGSARKVVEEKAKSLSVLVHILAVCPSDFPWRR